MTILNNAFMGGRETEYGKAVPITHGIEASGHQYKHERPISSSVAPRPGAHGEQADRNIITNHGGSGSVEFDILSKGFGFWLPALLGAWTEPEAVTEDADNLAYRSTASTSIEAPTASYTLQGLQHDVSNDGFAFTHLGSIFYKWKISHTVSGGNLMFQGDWMSQDVRRDVDAGNPNYPPGALPYDGKSATGYVTIGSEAARCVRSFELNVDLGFVLGRECLDGTELLKRPARGTWPTITGKISMDWHGLDLQDHYLAVESVDIAAAYTGPKIDEATNHGFDFTLPSCLITADPVITHNAQSSSDVPVMELEFKVQHDATKGDMAALGYTSTDSTI